MSSAPYNQQVHACVSIGINCVNTNRGRRPTSEIMEKVGEVQLDPSMYPWLRAVPRGNAVHAPALASRSWMRAMSLMKIAAIGVTMMIGVLLILLNPSNSWPLVVRNMGILFATRVMVVPLILCLQNNSSFSWPLMILMALGASGIFVLLNPRSPWSWVVVVMTLQVIMAAKTLVEFGFVTAFLTLDCLHYFRNLWAWLILVFGIVVLAMVLDGVEDKLGPGLLMSFRICMHCWLLQLLQAAIPRRIRNQTRRMNHQWREAGSTPK
ncbi:unnamed protein product [Urochloa humidicola]